MVRTLKKETVEDVTYYTIAIILSVLIFILGGFLIYGTVLHKNPRAAERYQAEVVFCDNRPNRTVIVVSRAYPDKIITKNRAAPTWANLVNVCEVINIKLVTER